MMPLIVLASTLLAGSAWCSMLCYFGPFDSLAAGKKGVQPYPSWLLVLQRYGRATVLVAGVLLALVLGHTGLAFSAAVRESGL